MSISIILSSKLFRSFFMCPKAIQSKKIDLLRTRGNRKSVSGRRFAFGQLTFSADSSANELHVRPANTLTHSGRSCDDKGPCLQSLFGGNKSEQHKITLLQPVPERLSRYQ